MTIICIRFITLRYMSNDQSTLEKQADQDASSPFNSA